jgi:hypothetical protein
MPFPRACVAVLLAALAGAPAGAADVDLALVLAIDTSSSVNDERYDLQIRGYADAFRDPSVAEAIGHGPNGAIAVTFAQWAGYGQYRQIVGWTVIRDAATAGRFASAIAETSRLLDGSTSVSGAIDYSARLLRSSGHQARRRVIDVSGDGRNNNGRTATAARDDAVAAGITINGLPILDDRPGYFSQYNIPNLDLYYRDCVIGGPGAFMVVAGSFKDFGRAVRRKLILEIAGRTPPEASPRIVPVQAGRGDRIPPPCDIGEQIWRNRYEP